MIALLRLHSKILFGFFLLLFGSLVTQAQTKTISGRVVDAKDNSPIPNISVTVKGSRSGTQTSADGSFRLTIPTGATTLTFSGIGYDPQEVSVAGKDAVEVSLKTNNASIGEVVVVGYGSSRKKDLTGSVASVKAKDFNKGPVIGADQLIQGKISGVQITQNSGAPGTGTTFRIRGAASVRAGNDPLYVVDGIPLDGRTARPAGNIEGDLGGLGGMPGGNPLNFLNPNDIASIDVLKDASATAIYGSRGANGVVLITTKRGQAGTPKIEFGALFGTSKIAKRLEYLNGDEYRKALTDYGITSGNFGGNVDALDEILQNGSTQSYNIAVGSGNQDNRYRVSLGYLDQKGIVRKTSFKKYSLNFNSNLRFLENKRLGLDIGVTANQNIEDIAPISNKAGFRGSLIGAALQWNPTKPLRKPNGQLDINQGGSEINPVAYSDALDDRAQVTTLLASIAPSYKITNELEYKMLVSINYSSGVRKQQIRSYINLDGYQADAAAGRKGGWGRIANAELITRQITHTLNYNKQLNADFNLGALIGYEYMKFDNKGSDQSGRDFDDFPFPYYNALGFSTQGTRTSSSFFDPTSELQSFFGRANVGYKNRYLLTATFRADGSSKFGSDNRYGYFPSLSAAWNVSEEKFFKVKQIDNLKVRVGWGQTGNQEFPAGAAQTRFVVSSTGSGSLEQSSSANPSLKWQTDQQFNAGIDFAILGNRITGTIDYFNKQTKDLIVNLVAAQPSPGTRIWKNIDGVIENKGFEIALNATIIKKRDLTWTFGVNATFLKNEITGLSGPLLTGEINGQGLSGAFVQRMTNGQPLNVYYVRDFQGIDANGQAKLANDGASFVFAGTANPTRLLGLTTSLAYKKLNLEINMNGAFGHKIYNNTANAVLPINNLGSRNIAKELLSLAPREALSSPITTSNRYLESGDFLRLANATLSYNIGSFGKVIKGANVFITGQNLFVITNFTGFDPEVNVDKNINGIPSFGIEYTPYPTARAVNFGINFTL